MGKKYRSKHRSTFFSDPFAVLDRGSLPVAVVLLFLFISLGVDDTMKGTALLLIPLTLICGLLGIRRLLHRVTPPLIALLLVVCMDALTLFYALSGKFALREFLQVLNAFCLTLLLLVLAGGEGDRPGRWMASVLEGGLALSGLVSIDLISTRWVSTPVLGILSLFSNYYRNLSGVEPGIRIISMFANPNVFAGMIGLGVLLSLGLVLSSEKRGERCFHLVCLFISALAFVLAFSMGASATIAVAFLVYLALERRERRAELFLLMLKTLVLTVLAAALISMTAFHAWSGIQPVPLLALVGGSAALCALDLFVGRRAVEKLSGSKKLPFLIGSAVAVLAVFLTAACSMTGGAILNPGEVLRRAAYPDAGDYTLSAAADGPVQVSIETQNQRDTMMHTSTVLYQGALDQASFTVPEDSMVVYFNFTASQAVSLDSVSYTGANGSDSVPLGYKLLPSFIANRLQGLWANQNAIQRLVFFSDGMKLFRRSPVIGLGLGSFENAIASVQSFYYETRYAHNHYVQALVDTGIIGLILFVGLISVSAAAVFLARKKEQFHPLTPALGAALVFMAGHAATEVIFTHYAYLPAAFIVFGLIGLCCGEAIPAAHFLTGKVKAGVLAGAAAFLIAFLMPLWNNTQANQLVMMNLTFPNLSRAVEMDKFEWADYMLTYVVNTMDADVDDEIRQQADEYAQRLSQLDSNMVPFYLADYYLTTGRTEQGIAMVEKYVTYVSANPDTWQQAFDLLAHHERDEDVYRAGLARIKELMDAWNAENMGEIQVNAETQAFLARVIG